MRFCNRSGLSVRRFIFDRPEAPEPPAPVKEPSAPLKAADLDNPYSRYYGQPRTREELVKNRSKT